MRAIVVRHYKTLLNSAGRIMGWQDAPRVKDWFADVSYVDAQLRERGIALDAIYSSDLERARQTAMYYGRSHGIHIVHDSPALNELDYGTLSARSKKWVERHIPEHKMDPDFVYPGGESFRQMQRRSTAFISSLARTLGGKTILVVVHAGVIRGLVSHFLGLDYATQLKRKISHRYIGEFFFAGEVCVRYDELGKPSGFARDPERVLLPWRRPVATDRRGVGRALTWRAGLRPDP
ncbi:MAG: histidine phosphatase family protein [Gammaproteobacteria bacterium]|jgi:broad specificity phosphatase PhoE